MTLFDYIIDVNLPPIQTEGKAIINTINPHSYCVAKKDAVFKNALKSSDVLLPDGAGIVISSLLLYRKRIRRITGSELHLYMLGLANEAHLKVFYLGASNDTLNALKTKVNKEYPNITVDVFSPPYKAEFSVEDSSIMIERINKFQPHILFVGMTAPKQEKWVYQHSASINANNLCSIGAVFDFFTGRVKRPGVFWQKLGLEWLPRLIREPKRLFRRNFISTPQFLIDVVVERIRMLVKA